MQLIKNYLSHLERVKQEIPVFIKDAIFENSDLIINILQENQLAKGQDSTGTMVGVYSWATDVYYANDPHNKPRASKTKGDPYNFEWSGEFYDSMNIKVNSQSQDYDIFSTTGRDREMQKWFGTDLTILTKENNDWINKNIIEPYVSKQISSLLFVF
jgi:hypothetical protein